MKTICMIVLLAVFAAIDAQEIYQPQRPAERPYVPVTVEPFETVTPGEFSTIEPNNPAVMREWANQQQQQDAADQEAPDSESREDVDTTDGPDLLDAPDAQDAPDAIAGNQGAAGQSSGEQAGSPANFINMGGKPFKGFKKPTKQDAQTIAGKTIGIILSTLFLVVAAAVVAVIVIRRKRSA